MEELETQRGKTVDPYTEFKGLLGGREVAHCYRRQGEESHRK
jgi:hypothetical protein